MKQFLRGNNMSGQIIKSDPIAVKVVEEVEPHLEVKARIQELLRHELLDVIPKNQDRYGKLYNCIDLQMTMFTPKNLHPSTDLHPLIIKYQQEDRKLFHVHEDMLRLQYRKREMKNRKTRKLNEKKFDGLINSFLGEKASYKASLDKLLLRVPEVSFFVFLRNLHFELLIDPVMLNIASGFKRITFPHDIPSRIFWRIYDENQENDSLITIPSESEQEPELLSFDKFMMLPRFYSHAPELSREYLIKFIGKHGVKTYAPPPHLIDLIDENPYFNHLHEIHFKYSVKILPFLGECLRWGFTARDIFWNLSDDELFDPTDLMFINPKNGLEMRLKEAISLFLDTYHERLDDK